MIRGLVSGLGVTSFSSLSFLGEAFSLVLFESFLRYRTVLEGLGLT